MKPFGYTNKFLFFGWGCNPNQKTMHQKRAKTKEAALFEDSPFLLRHSFMPLKDIYYYKAKPYAKRNATVP